ncbi:ABC1 kinase family protein [Halocatena marina]|uniref:ABC1 kinase family protein n=1 Tax=Halocatena marina TaxID=2934937 RepID=UPI002224E30B|nr:AarF/ABC1/UbiB kinase family protein [Halocatena marina]
MTLRAYRRFFVVAWQFLPLLVAFARDRRRFLVFGTARDVSSEQRRQRAQTLLDSLLTLGPTFIKLGQLLSTRPDVLPPEYIGELTQLQDRVPPAPWPDAKDVIEEELGPLEDAYDNFDTESISGASLGQVYVAEYDDEAVAVKVRRPGIESLVRTDLRVIKFSLPLLMPFVDQAQAFSLETLADEFSTVIRQEMDYHREATMLREIQENFTDDTDILIPSVVDERSTGRILTMEYVGGTKISEVDDIDALGVDRTQLAKTLQEVYLQMIVIDGVFHADPHPGNLAVKPDGTLVFYDFGMSGRVDSFVQNRIVDFYIAIANQDIDGILDALIEMGTLSPEADRQVMANVMELAIADARGEDIGQYRVQQIVGQVEDTIYEFPLRLPPNLALVLRVATVVEGVCVTLDPNFDFIAVATEFLREQGYLQASARQFVEERVDEVDQAVRSSIRLPPKLEQTLDRVDRDSLVVQAELNDPDGVFDRLAKRLVLGMGLTVGLLSTVLLYIADDALGALVVAAISCVIGVLLYRSFRKRRGIRARPQFTRQSMRQQREDESGMNSDSSISLSRED